MQEKYISSVIAMHSPTVDVVVPVLPGEVLAPTLLEALPRPLVRNVFVGKVGNAEVPATSLGTGVEVMDVEPGGFGAAVIAGLQRLESLAERPAIVVVLPGNGSYDPSEMTALLRPIVKSRYDLVIGAHALGPGHGASLPVIDRLGSRVAVTLIRVIYGSWYSDLSPYFAVRFPALVALGVTDRKAGFGAELRVKAVKIGLRVAEVPVTLRQPQQPAGGGGTLKDRLEAGSRTFFQIVRNATLR